MNDKSNDCGASLTEYQRLVADNQHAIYEKLKRDPSCYEARRALFWASQYMGIKETCSLLATIMTAQTLEDVKSKIAGVVAEGIQMTAHEYAEIDERIKETTNA